MLGAKRSEYALWDATRQMWPPFSLWSSLHYHLISFYWKGRQFSVSSVLVCNLRNTKSEHVLSKFIQPWDCWSSGLEHCRWRLSRLFPPCQWSPPGPRYGREFCEVALGREVRALLVVRDTLPGTGVLVMSGSACSGSSPGMATCLLRTYRYMLLIACLMFTRSNLKSSH